MVNAYAQDQKRLSDNEIRQIEEKYSAVVSTYELAVEFGYHRRTISLALKKSDIEVSHEASQREALTKRILEMYARFTKPVDIGKELGINVVAVRKNPIRELCADQEQCEIFEEALASYC